MRPWIAYVLLAVVVGLAGILKARDLQSKQRFEHNDGISLLAAAAQQDAFERTASTGVLNTWQPAATWQQFVTPQQGTSFHAIQRDLNHNDLHPPLYFWLLSRQLQWTGEIGKAAYLGNVLASLASVLVFFLLLRLRLAHAPALIGTALFAFSPVLAGPFMVLRQYDLTLLATVLLLYLASRLLTTEDTGPARSILLVMLAVSAFLGLQTYGQFLLVTGCVAAATLLVHQALSARLGICAALMAGGAAFAVSNPGFIENMARQRRQLQPASTAEFVTRIEELVKSTEVLVGVLPDVAAALFTLLLVHTAWRSVTAWRDRTTNDPVWLFWSMFSCALIGLFVLQYVGMQAPRHAIGARYFMVILPAYTLLLVMVFRAFNMERVAVLYAVVLLLVSANMVQHQASVRAVKERPVVDALQGAERIVFNNPARGALTPLLPLVSKSSRLLVTSSDVSIERFASLVADLHVGDVVVLQQAYDVDPQRVAEHLRALTARYRVFDINSEGRFFGIAGPSWRRL